MSTAKRKLHVSYANSHASLPDNSEKMKICNVLQLHLLHANKGKKNNMMVHNMQYKSKQNLHGAQTLLQAQCVCVFSVSYLSNR